MAPNAARTFVLITEHVDVVLLTAVVRTTAIVVMTKPAARMVYVYVRSSQNSAWGDKPFANLLISAAPEYVSLENVSVLFQALVVTPPAIVVNAASALMVYASHCQNAGELIPFAKLLRNAAPVLAWDLRGL